MLEICLEEDVPGRASLRSTLNAAGVMPVTFSSLQPSYVK
jgi:hypothetical protein